MNQLMLYANKNFHKEKIILYKYDTNYSYISSGNGLFFFDICLFFFIFFSFLLFFNVIFEYPDFFPKIF